MSFSRRFFLKTAGAFGLGFTGLQSALGHGFRKADAPAVRDGYGPLLPDPEHILDLPEGFTYRILARAGELMQDGLYVPAAADGMAAFPGPKGLTLLVCNHEVSAGRPADQGAFGSDLGLVGRLPADRFYDIGRDAGPCLGGTTTIVYDTVSGRKLGQHLSLAGTLTNCAGGPTPWNTWLTCEENTQRAGDFCREDHGYVFEVPASAKPGLAEPVPLRDMGRFRHEAVAVDPRTGVIYLTEDLGDGLLYRFLPHEPGRLRAGGRLQALAVRDAPSFDTRNWDAQTVAAGDVLAVDWVDLDDVEAPEDDLRHRGFAAGAARFARGEGMWHGNDAVYFACTSGGVARKGQIWRYLPSPVEGHPEEARQPGRLELFVEPNDGALVENADNLTVAPWGDLIVCEDGPGDNFLFGVTPSGDIYKVARNAATPGELAGLTFSPDGTTLFVNIQRDGLTLAISGPWRGAAGKRS